MPLACRDAPLLAHLCPERWYWCSSCSSCTCAISWLQRAGKLCLHHTAWAQRQICAVSCLGCRDVCATCERIQVPPGASPLPLHVPASSTGLGRMGGLRAALCSAPFCFPVLANRHPASPSKSKAVFQPHSLLLLFLHFLVCLGISLHAWCASSS